MSLSPTGSWVGKTPPSPHMDEGRLEAASLQGVTQVLQGKTR